MWSVEGGRSGHSLSPFDQSNEDTRSVQPKRTKKNKARIILRTPSLCTDKAIFDL